jgi:hypothetical protein
MTTLNRRDRWIPVAGADLDEEVDMSATRPYARGGSHRRRVSGGFANEVDAQPIRISPTDIGES